MTHFNDVRATVGLVLFSLAVLSVFAAPDPGAAQEKPDKLWVYVGTYTGPKSKGIYLLELDLASGALTSKGLAGEATNPSFLALHPSRKFLYAVGEVGSVGGKKGGGVSAFAIDPKTGKLALLNEQSSVGGGPCHIVVDKEGKNALVANYGGGSVAALPIQPDGKLKEASSFIQHKGTSVDKQRQQAPHGHSINLDAANRFAFAADLGLDQVLIYAFDPAKGTLTAHQPPFATVAPGAGPRHFAFHPSGKFAYVINEMGNTVTAFRYDPAAGSLKEIQTIGTLPKDFSGKSYTAEVVVHPSGKFLYGSNRGHDSIAVFSIDDAGKLTAAGHAAVPKTPRNFNIDPTGTYLLSAGQNTGTIIVLRIDPQTGALKDIGKSAEVPGPVCVKFMPIAR